MSFNNQFSVLSFSETEVVNKATRLGVSLGSTEKEVAAAVNELLDTEADRAMVILQKMAASTTVGDAGSQRLSSLSIHHLYQDLAPEDEGTSGGPTDCLVNLPVKVTRNLSAMRRTSRFPLKKKFYE